VTAFQWQQTCLEAIIPAWPVVWAGVICIKNCYHHCQSTSWVKKGCHPKHGYNFVDSWSVCKTFSLLQRAKFTILTYSRAKNI